METRIAELRYKEVISVEDGARYGYVGDMEVDLETGRKHQIRAHLSELGCPVAGDRTYGAVQDPLGRLCLHAHALVLLDPFTRQERSFLAPAPKEFARLAR